MNGIMPREERVPLAATVILRRVPSWVMAIAKRLPSIPGFDPGCPIKCDKDVSRGEPPKDADDWKAAARAKVPDFFLGRIQSAKGGVLRLEWN